MAPEFKDSKLAFEEAIRQGRLSTNTLQWNYAGRYMYMGTWAGIDKFKAIDTREYLPDGERRKA